MGGCAVQSALYSLSTGPVNEHALSHMQRFRECACSCPDVGNSIAGHHPYEAKNLKALAQFCNVVARQNGMALFHGSIQTCDFSKAAVWLACEANATLVTISVSELPRILSFYRGLDVHCMVVARVQVLKYCCTLCTPGCLLQVLPALVQIATIRGSSMRSTLQCSESQIARSRGPICPEAS